MNRPYTETQVLRKLDIPDFRHLTKDKVIAFATMVPYMDPDVAKKALEQFPDFATTSLDVMKEYKTIIEEAMKDDRESTRVCYDMYNRVMDSLEKVLDSDLSFEEKTYVLEQMKNVADEVARKDCEKSNNRIKLIGIVGGVATAVVAILGSAIGVNLTSKQRDVTTDDNSENI